MKLAIHIFILSISGIALSCHALQKDHASPPIPPRPIEDSIEMHAILAEGTIILKDEHYYFKVSKVIKRGREVPEVLTGQLLKLRHNIHLETTNKTIKACLSCEDYQYQHHIWSLKIQQ